MQKEEEQIGWFLPIFLDLPAVLLMTTRDCIWGTRAHPSHSWQNAQSIQLSMLSSWQEQLLQMRNHGLPHTGEGERPLGHGSSCSSFHLPGFWKAGRSLPQASPNSSTFPTVVSTPVYPVHHVLLPTQPGASAGWRACTHCGLQAGAASLVGRSPRDMLEHPEQLRLAEPFSSCHKMRIFWLWLKKTALDFCWSYFPV